jgi:hypothetical protein
VSLCLRLVALLFLKQQLLRSVLLRGGPSAEYSATEGPTVAMVVAVVVVLLLLL